MMEVDPYEKLAMAIVFRASDDYLQAKRKNNEKLHSDVVRFFNSQWYLALTTLDSKKLIRKLDQEYQKEIENGKRKKRDYFSW